jgi:hypothetical protein
MYSLLENNAKPTSKEIEDYFDGTPIILSETDHLTLCQEIFVDVPDIEEFLMQCSLYPFNRKFIF